MQDNEKAHARGGFINESHYTSSATIKKGVIQLAAIAASGAAYVGRPGSERVLDIRPC